MDDPIFAAMVRAELMDDPTFAAMVRLLRVRDACARAAADHPEGCPCVVCGAAAGNVGDLLVLADAVAD